jgi:hypothetical protein
LVQTAVAVELLLLAPMRLANLNELRLDRHLSWVRGSLHIRIPRQEVKNREDLDYVLPAAPSAQVKQYVDEVRPQLADGLNPYLFPGRQGRPKERSRLMRQITQAKATSDSSGSSRHPHGSEDGQNPQSGKRDSGDAKESRGAVVERGRWVFGGGLTWQPIGTMD